MFINADERSGGPYQESDDIIRDLELLVDYYNLELKTKATTLSPNHKHDLEYIIQEIGECITRFNMFLEE